MTNLPAAEAAATAKYPDTGESWGDGRSYERGIFLAGHAWTLQHLSEQGAGFDKLAAIDQAKHEDSDGYFGFLTGAEWQHAMDAQVIAAYRTSELAMNEKLNAHHDEWQREFADQDAEMERLRCRVTEYIDLAAKHALEAERLHAEKVGHIQLIGGQEAEIIKLRAELAGWKREAKEYAVEMVDLREKLAEAKESYAALKSIDDKIMRGGK